MNWLGKTLTVLLIALMMSSALPTQGEDVRGHTNTDDPAETPSVPATAGKGGGYFIENLGQWGSHIRFVATTSFGEAVFTDDGVVYDVRVDGGGHRVKVAFATDVPVGPVGIDRMQTLSNYFVGSDPTSWVTGASSYRELVYEDVWPGVNIRYHFRATDLKYDVVVGPDADPSSVGFTVKGHEDLDVTDDGIDITLSGELAIQDRELLAYYEDGQAVDVSFGCFGSDGFGFDVDKAPGRTLVIDPVVVHASTYIGGTYDDNGYDVEVDPDGNIYVTGWTGSLDYPVTTGAYCETMKGYDVLVTKLNDNASEVIWSTYLGGTNTDFINGIELDDQGYVYVVGNTWSTDFPTTEGAMQREFNLGMNTYGPDFWISKLKPDGDALVYSTYAGGSGPETPGDFKLWNENVTVVGWTDSKDFPTDQGPMGTVHGDAVLFMLNDKGTGMAASQFWGGFSSEMANALEFASNGDVVVGGRTSSMDFYVTPGVFQEVRQSFASGFVSRYSPTEDVIKFSTYLGGASDSVTSITVDEDQYIYAAGQSFNSGPGTTFPVTPGAFDVQYNGRTEGFVCKMDPNGTRLEYSSLLGGDGDDNINDIDLMDGGELLVVGQLTSPGNFTVTPDGYDTEFKGESEGFAFVMNADGTAPVYSTYHGGSNADGIGGVAITGWDNWVLTGETDSPDFTVTNEAFQNRTAGLWDVFVSVVGDLLPTSAPSNLTAIGGEGHIILDWERPLEDNGYPVWRYLVYRGTSPDALELHSVLDARTTAVDKEVDWGVTYHYGIVALNGKGVSPMSNVDSARSVTVPDMPLNLTGTVHEDRIALEWEVPEFTGGIPVTEYRLYRVKLGAGSAGLHATIAAPTTSFDDTDLVDRTTYVYTLTAVNEWGESRDLARITLRATGVTTPPRELDHTYGDLYINVTWRRPADEYGLPVVSYNVYRTDVDGPIEVVTSVAAPTRFLSDTSVEVGMLYSYAVSAVNAKGESTPCQAIEAMAKVSPDPPAGADAEAKVEFVRVTWSPPGFDGASPVLGYRIYLGTGPDDAVYLGGVNVENVTEPRLVFLHDVPYNGIAKHYFVTAVNAEGESDPSRVVETESYQVPGAPRDLEVTWGDRELELSWLAPEVNGGTAITSFTLYRRAAGEDGFVELAPLMADILDYLDQTVFNGVEYTYRLTATNLVGEGSPSVEITGRPAGLPDVPVTVAAESMDGSARITWQPPEATGGLPIDGYQVFGISEGFHMDLLAEVGAYVTEFTQEGLENGGAYLFAVRAVTGAGTSALSEIVEARPVGSPAAVDGLVAFWIDDHVYVAWSTPLDVGGTTVTVYMLHREDRDDGNWTEVSVAAMALADHDVEPGMTYTYTVYAVNAVGDGTVAFISIEVPKLEPTPPADPEANLWPYLVVALVLTVAALIALGSFRQRGVVE